MKVRCGTTISTDKQEIINIVRNQYDTYKQRKEEIAKCDEEMAKCQQLLDKLDTHNETTNESLKIVELQNEINELLENYTDDKFSDAKIKEIESFIQKLEKELKELK